MQVLDRKLGETHARFADDNFTLDIETTGRFDVSGAWEDVTDAAVEDTWPLRTPHKAQLFGAQVPLPAGHPLATMDSLEPREEILQRMCGKPQRHLPLRRV